MSVCPKCQHRLRISDWRPNCPHCGVNLMTHGFEERFYEDAKRAELSMAGMRVRWQQIKAGWLGNRWAKLRLGLMALPLLTLLAPAAMLEVHLPLDPQKWNAGLLGIVSFAMGGSDALGFLLAETSSPLFGNVFTLFAAALALTAAAAVLGVFVLLLSVLSALSVRRLSAVVTVLGFGGAAVMLGAFIVSVFLALAGRGSGFVSASMGFAPLPMAAFLAVGLVNLHLWRHGVPVCYAEGDEERAAIYRKVKRSEISLARLPFPVVETADTRAREALIEGGDGNG